MHVWALDVVCCLYYMCNQSPHCSSDDGSHSISAQASHYLSEETMFLRPDLVFSMPVVSALPAWSFICTQRCEQSASLKKCTNEMNSNQVGCGTPLMASLSSVVSASFSPSDLLRVCPRCS